MRAPAKTASRCLPMIAGVESVLWRVRRARQFFAGCRPHFIKHNKRAFAKACTSTMAAVGLRFVAAPVFGRPDVARRRTASLPVAVGNHRRGDSAVGEIGRRTFGSQISK